MSATKRSAQQAVIDALGVQEAATVSELAAAAGLGRSTVGKALAVLERSGQATRRGGERDGARRLPDRWSLTARDASSSPDADARRLRPGQLDGLVLDYLREHANNEPHTPAAVAKALRRSSGAVGNCLARLAAAGRVRQTSDHPRCYSPL
jgi:DNA-binding IclR family transcriptional regulator